MSEPRSDTTKWVLNAFTERNGTVHWLGENAWKSITGVKSNQVPDLKFPFGEPAGSQLILGHGRRVNFSRHVLPTFDLLDALQHFSRRMWWARGASEPVVAPTDPEHIRLAAQVAERAVARIEADGGELRWKVPIKTPDRVIEAGSTVTGTTITGAGRKLVSISGVGVMKHDLVHFLSTGHWPWDQSGPVAVPLTAIASVKATLPALEPLPYSEEPEDESPAWGPVPNRPGAVVIKGEQWPELLSVVRRVCENERDVPEFGKLGIDDLLNAIDVFEWAADKPEMLPSYLAGSCPQMAKAYRDRIAYIEKENLDFWG